MCLLLFCQRLLQLLHGTSRICYALQGTCMLNQTERKCCGLRMLLSCTQCCKHMLTASPDNPKCH